MFNINDNQKTFNETQTIVVIEKTHLISIYIQSFSAKKHGGDWYVMENTKYIKLQNFVRHVKRNNKNLRSKRNC